MAQGWMQATMLYVAIGALFALVWSTMLSRLEPATRGGSLGFRLLVLPGAVLLWPLLAALSFRVLWFRQRGSRDSQSPRSHLT